MNDEYERGRQYAQNEIAQRGDDAIIDLDAQSMGAFDFTDFDRGIRDVLREVPQQDNYGW